MKQITSAFDRFYENQELKNSVTGLHYFPSVTHILDWDKTPPHLKTWYKNLGHYADDYMNHRANIGSTVHNCVEMMIKDGVSFTDGKENLKKKTYSITKFFYDSYHYSLSETDSLFIKRALKGFLEWVDYMKNEYDDFEIIESESQICGEDYAGTIDLYVKFAGYTHIIDLKTSKQVFVAHEVQVESYRRAKGVDFGSVLKLGSDKANSTNYKFETVKTAKKQDRLWKRFQIVKSLYYMDNPEAQPTTEEFPEEFKLNPK